MRSGRRWGGIVASLMLAALLPAEAVAQQDTEEFAALRAEQAKLVEAVRARDAGAVAEMFAAEGSMILGDGSVLAGPGAIRAHWADVWAGGGPNPYREWPGELTDSGPLVVDAGGFGPDEATSPVGHYARVWRRDAEGRWRVKVYVLGD